MFAQMMIPHHEQAVQMAQLALDNSTASADVKGLAQQIKAAQAPEIATVSGWLSTWGAPKSAGMNHGASGMMTDQDMSGLAKASGAEFDKMWLAMMVQHHQGAIAMANEVLGTTADPQVKQLAQSIVDGQKSEITVMQGLLN